MVSSASNSAWTGARCRPARDSPFVGGEIAYSGVAGRRGRDAGAAVYRPGGRRAEPDPWQGRLPQGADLPPIPPRSRGLPAADRCPPAARRFSGSSGGDAFRVGRATHRDWRRERVPGPERVALRRRRGIRSPPRQREEASQGRTILRYQQTYRGVPVLAGDLVVDVSRGNDIISVNGEAANGLSLGVKPSITAAQARHSAIATIALANGVAASSLTASTPRLWIYDARLFGPDGAYGSKLAWRTEVTGGFTGDPSRARHGRRPERRRPVPLLARSSRSLPIASSATATTSKAEKTCGTSGEPVVITANKAGYNSASADAQRAFDYSGNTWTFYFKRFGRNSLNGSGLQLKSTVRVSATTRYSCPYQNAFWNGTQMFYGDGYATRRRCRRPRADARPYGIHVAPVVFLRVGRHQRGDVRHHGRVHRPGLQRQPRHRHRGIEVADR